MKLTPFKTTLKNGASVLVREVTSADRHLLEIGFAHLSGRARYFRFLGAHKNLTEQELDRFTATSDPDHVAVGALLIDGPIPEPVGIARYIRLPDQRYIAEIAVTIADSHQHQGLGSLLLGVLAEFAKRGGITEFNALVHSENTAMLGLLDQFGATQTALGGEDIEATFPVSAISVPISKSSAAKRETLGGAARKIIKLTSAKLHRLVNFHPELPEIIGPDQPTSVWENEGGAIVPSVHPNLGERVTSPSDPETRGTDCPHVPRPACFSFPDRPRKDISMTPETNKSANVADKMKTVKAAWDKAPSGPKKDAALKHYRAAEKAHLAKNDADTHKELDAATHALA